MRFPYVCLFNMHTQTVIVEGIISDSNAAARGLWMKSFRTKQGTIRDVVPFKEFISACIKQCRLNLPRRSKWKDILEFKALHLILGETRSCFTNAASSDAL